MPPLSGRASCPAAFAVALASLLSVGCLNTDEKKDPLLLGSDTRSRLTNPADANPPKTARAASFDPAATGGSGVSVQNSFNRNTPVAGTGVGNFAGPLPPPQIGQQPVATAPPLQGASYGEPPTEPGRTAMAARQPSALPPVAPPQPLKPTMPDEPTPSPFGPETPKLGPPNDPPPVQQTKFDALPTPAPIRPVQLDPERALPPLPVNPITPPGPAANEPLPVLPPAPGFVPSPTDAPIPGVGVTPKLPPPPPIRPQ